MSRSTLATRTARIAATTLTLMLASTSAAVAQDAAAHSRAWELRVSSGALVASGAQRAQLKDAELTAAQVSWVMRERLALTGTFSWARSRDRISAGTPKLDVFTSDIGAELRSGEWRADKMVSLRTFAGLGAGARSYNYRSLDVPATHNIAGYGSVGGEVGIGRVAVRLEAREYAAGFKPLIGAGKSTARNDAVIMAALRFNRHRARQD